MLDLSYYIIVSFSILLFAISKSGFSGGGLALISVTLLSITYGPLTAIAILMYIGNGIKFTKITPTKVVTKCPKKTLRG